MQKLLVHSFIIISIAVSAQETARFPERELTPAATTLIGDHKDKSMEVAIYKNSFRAKHMRESVLFVVDGKVMDITQFELRHKELITNIATLQIIKNIDSILGYRTKRKRSLIIIQTKKPE